MKKHEKHHGKKKSSKELMPPGTKKPEAMGKEKKKTMKSCAY